MLINLRIIMTLLFSSSVLCWQVCTNNQNGCATCSGYDTCGTCLTNTPSYVIKDGQCTLCTPSYCIICPTNTPICTYCQNGYGLSASGSNTCVRCAVSDCWRCGVNAFICTTCNRYYGYPAIGGSSTNTCVRCTDSYCAYCVANASLCTRCDSNYTRGVLNGVCVSCFNTNCQYCYNNASICIGCYSGYGVYNSSCMRCTDYDSNCISCNPYDVTMCMNCSTNCLSCNFNNSCTSCVDNSRLLTNRSPVICSDICGDSVTGYLECDN